MSAILKIKGAGGGTINVPALQGASAYELAVLGGYEGTESDFASAMANIANGSGGSGTGNTGTLTPAGSTTQPIYINNNGVPTATTYNLNKSVPSDAKFTDTTYSAASGGGLSLSSNAFSIADLSGMDSGSYGPSDNVNLTYSGTFSIPYITTNKKGQITAISTKTMTMPAAPSGGTGGGSSNVTITLNGTSTASPSFYAPTSVGTSGAFLKSSGSGAPTWASVTIPSITLNGSSNSSPSFYAPISAGTNGQYLKSSGSGAPTWVSVTIPSITLNGTSTASPSFYAPTSAGTSGQYLKSNGSGAPTWASITIPSITLNGSSNSSPSFYAPTSAGTSGQYLKSNGSGAPTWATISTGGSTVSISNRQSSGTRLATITIDSTAYDLYYTDTDTNTHNTAYLYVGTSSGTSNSSTSNGSTYLILSDGGTYTRRKISGSGTVSVSSDSSGNITINGTGGGSTVSISNRQTSGTKLATITIDSTAYDLYYTDTNTNTTYSAATNGGLTLNGTAFSIASTGITGGSYGPSASATLTSNGTFISFFLEKFCFLFSIYY